MYLAESWSVGVLECRDGWACPSLHISTTPFRAGIVGQLHHVVEVFVGAADLQDVHQPIVRPRNRLELLDATKLPLEGPGVFERAAINDLNRPQRAQFVARQPDFAVAALADGAEQFVIGNRRRSRSDGSVGVRERWSGAVRWIISGRIRHFWQSSVHGFSNLATKRRKRAR